MWMCAADAAHQMYWKAPEISKIVIVPLFPPEAFNILMRLRSKPLGLVRSWKQSIIAGAAWLARAPQWETTNIICQRLSRMNS